MPGMPDTSKKRIKQLVQYIKKNPEDTFSKFALALELLKQDELKKAQVLFESVQDQDPNYIGVYYHLGHLYLRQGRTDRAKETFQEGLRVARKASDTHSASELQEALLQLELEEEDDNPNNHHEL